MACYSKPRLPNGNVAPHCIIWVRFRDGTVQKGCPHCWKVLATHDEADEELALRQCEASTKAHRALCPIPVRSPRVTGTPVQSAPGRRPSAATRAIRTGRR